MHRLIRLVLIASLAPAFGGCVGMAAARGGTDHPDALGRVLDTADANHDGMITRAEFQDARLRIFIRLDHNGDGYIDKSDASGGPLRRRKVEQVIAGLVNRLDKDGDGRISRQEFQSAPMVVFERADLNHDGVVDAQELAAFHARQSGR